MNDNVKALWIRKVAVEWYLEYANKPAFVVYVDDTDKLRDLKWIYELHAEKHHDILVSTNNMPWVRFVAVDRKHRDSDPVYGGNCGGTFKLADGSEYKSRTGWSSRAGAINKLFGLDIVDVTVRVKGQSVGWAGYALHVEELRKELPDDVYIVKEYRFDDEEYYFTPSIVPDKVVKPTPSYTGNR